MTTLNRRVMLIGAVATTAAAAVTPTAIHPPARAATPLARTRIRKDPMRVRKDLPTLLDDLVRRENIPGKGEMPRDLHSIYLHTRAKEAPQIALQPVLAERDFSAWRLSPGTDFLEGLPGLSLEQTTTAAIAVTPSDDRSQESARPDWMTLSFLPRPATPVPVRHLRRRNGRAVIPDHVIGNDDRVTFYPSTWPWLCIGRIEVWTYGSYKESGNGALVGKNVVLTASHMVPWGAGPGNCAMKFTPAYYDGRSTLGSSVYSYVERAKGYPDYDQGDDMAVLKLYTPLGNSLGYFGY